jgi:hypothetical protein
MLITVILHAVVIRKGVNYFARILFGMYKLLRACMPFQGHYACVVINNNTNNESESVYFLHIVARSALFAYQ